MLLFPGMGMNASNDKPERFSRGIEREIKGGKHPLNTKG